MQPIVVNGTPFVTLDMIQAIHGERNNFQTWMIGQTFAIHNGVNLYFKWDYDRWVKKLPIID